MHRLQHRFGSAFPFLFPLIRWPAPDLALDGIQPPDPFQCFFGDGRSMRLMKIEELSPHVCPARGLLDQALLIKFFEAGIAICLKRSPEVFQMLPRMFSLPVR